MEVIIADDGSSDHPEQLILEFEDYFDVNYVRQKDLGYRLSHVRNLGVRALNMTTSSFWIVIWLRFQIWLNCSQMALS